MIHFDHLAFWQALDAVRLTRNLSWHGVWRATFVLATQHACTRGGKLSADSLAALLTWSGLRFEDYIIQEERSREHA